MSVDWKAPPHPVVSTDALPPQPDMPRIKILHVITKFSTGAGGNTLLSAVGMDPRVYEVWVAACTRGPEWEHPLWERAKAAGVRTFLLPRLHETISPANDLVVLLQLLRLIRSERFSIIHTHTAKAGLLGRIAGGLCRTPVIVHTYHSFPFHDYMSQSRRWAYLLLEHLVRPLTDQFLAVSPRVAREAVERRLAQPGRIAVVPSAVELNEIPDIPDQTLRRELGIPDSSPLVGTVGRIDFQKAPLDFVQMAAKVRAKRPDARFVIVGDGPLLDDVKREAARLGVDLILTGFRDDAVRIATGFDVFVISSLYEGLGRALTEALASGRPVVASAVNGVPDLVIPGVTGLLAPPRAPDRFAECVMWLLEHPVDAQRMGRQGRAFVLECFDPAGMCALIDETYARLLGLPRSTSPKVSHTLGASEIDSLVVLDDGSPNSSDSRRGAGAPNG